MPSFPRGLAFAGSHDLLWDVRRTRPVYARSRQGLPGEDGGDVLRPDAVEVKMQAAGKLTPGCGGCWSRVVPAADRGHAGIFQRQASTSLNHLHTSVQGAVPGASPRCAGNRPWTARLFISRRLGGQGRGWR